MRKSRSKHFSPNGGAGNDFKPGYSVDGPHPLEGIPTCRIYDAFIVTAVNGINLLSSVSGVTNYEELPTPEPLGKVAGTESGELQAMINLFGDYLVRCIYSKTWTLRDAALVKVWMSVAGLMALLLSYAISFDKASNGLRLFCCG